MKRHGNTRCRVFIERREEILHLACLHDNPVNTIVCPLRSCSLDQFAQNPAYASLVTSVMDLSRATHEWYAFLTEFAAVIPSRGSQSSTADRSRSRNEVYSPLFPNIKWDRHPTNLRPRLTAQACGSGDIAVRRRGDDRSRLALLVFQIPAARLTMRGRGKLAE